MSKEKTMKQSKQEQAAPEGAEGARRATEASSGGAKVTALAPGQRWSVARKREVALRLLRGEAVEGLSRELGVEIYRLEKWRERALAGIDASLRERDANDPLVTERDAALKRVGELSMEVELLREQRRKDGPLVLRRSR